MIIIDPSVKGRSLDHNVEYSLTPSTDVLVQNNGKDTLSYQFNIVEPVGWNSLGVGDYLACPVGKVVYFTGFYGYSKITKVEL